MSRIQRAGLSVAVQRLQQDYIRLIRDPVPFVTAHPLHTNIFEWHFLVRGPPDSPYSGGYYHGKLIFAKEYPFRPPSIYMVTPNGRFACNTSDFHPDTWNPAWSVSTILTGLLSFMLEDTPTMGSISTSTYEKRRMAKDSAEFNLNDEIFVELFPDVVQEVKTKLHMIQPPVNTPTSSSSFSSSTFTTSASDTSQNGLPGTEDAEAYPNPNRAMAGIDGGGGPGGNAGQLPLLAVVILFGIFAISVKMVMEFLGDSVG